MQHIRYIKRADLDVEKWNACIDAAPNGLIYAYALYLDAMCDNWDALVQNDYEAVMPLPWRKKWGIYYVYTPAFIQQLGLFSRIKDLDLLTTFLHKAETHFRFGDYFLNYPPTNHLKQRTNFILPLHQPYSELYKDFAKDLKKNIKKASTYKLQYKPSDDAETAIVVYKKLYLEKIESLKQDDFVKFSTLCQNLQSKQMLVIREVRDAAGTIQAIALCGKDNRRLYLLASSTTGDGKKLKANHFLLDQLIQEYSNTPFVLDFEGSDLPGVKYFYANFGGFNQPYYLYHWNNLPWPIRLLK